jgi:hypothetical protein
MDAEQAEKYLDEKGLTILEAEKLIRDAKISDLNKPSIVNPSLTKIAIGNLFISILSQIKQKHGPEYQLKNLEPTHGIIEILMGKHKQRLKPNKLIIIYILREFKKKNNNNNK